jgi:hypothetical protein
MLAEYTLRFFHARSGKIHAGKHIKESKYKTACGYWINTERLTEMFRLDRDDARVSCKKCFLVIREKGDGYE